MYTKELAKKYTSNRDDYKETDSELLEPLARIGVLGKDILDFGCGDGRHARNLLEMGAHKVSGIDVSPDMIELADKRRVDGLEFFVADGTKLPFEGGSFDIVFSNFVIHYFEDAHLPLAEISRVLKSSGYFIGTYNITDVKEGFEHLYNTNMPIRLGKKEDGIVVQNLIKPRPEIESALERAGFKVLVEKVLHHPNAVVDDSYEYRNQITKNAVLVVAQKA
jgi:ubiquinone/menaquinone biosynthesis C-methylase UbiE